MKVKDSCRSAPKAKQLPTKAASSKRTSGSEQGWSKAHLIAGLLAGLYLAYLYIGQLQLLHENQLWFSHLTKLERDLSFRSESALYYSYYKQLVDAPSLYQEISNLYRRNANSFQHFSMYPEIFLASAYRAAFLKHFMEPEYFYINVVFHMQGIQLLLLFFLAWVLSDTPIAGCLAALFIIFNRELGTRAHTAVTLRDSFAIPFILGGILCTSLYHHSNQIERGGYPKVLYIFLILMHNVCAVAIWESTQYIFLLEGITLFVVQTFGLVPKKTVWYLLLFKFAAVLTTSVVQPGYHNLLGSMFISFTIAWAVVSFVYQDCSDAKTTPRSSWVLQWMLTIGSSFIINMIFKFLFFGYKDTVLMFRYVSTKLGLAFYTDFEVLVSLCHRAFQIMSKDTLFQLVSNGLLPCYTFSLAVFLKPIVTQYHGPAHKNCKMKCSNTQGLQGVPNMDPMWTYTVILSILLGALSLWTARFQYLWVPYICSIAAAGVCHTKLWRDMAGMASSMGNMVRLTTIIAIAFAITLKETPALLSQLRVMKQLHAPDTVALMQWIDNHTAHNAVFAGSCQILAATHLCTGRATTVGPHIEDNWPSKHMWETYQIYAKLDPNVVHDIMRKLGTGFVIVENSLCSSAPNKCSLVGVMDLAGNITDDSPESTTFPRFCEALLSGSEHPILRHFTLVFKNQSFAIYKVE